ncbi:long-chain-fatty-acid--CoA ligase [Nafulsella turpanensis]|uniref:long-chain-fatty-acid--CoA ligase n=1 Tax=Nafulsella turpanensis TaxID=1265690 RepID=UPI000345E16F|nr:long-chain-fatty-acid--CoA ligase [Nafulsella turpanensis]
MENFPWVKEYPQGVASTVDYSQYSSLVDMLDQAFRKYADLKAFDNMGKTYTYKEIDEASRAFAAYLQKGMGLKKGDRIAIQMPNCLQYPVAMFGALRAGLVVVNTNPLYTPREMKHQFKDAGVKAVVIMSMFAHHLEEVLPETDIQHVVVTDLGDMLGGLKGSLVNFVVKKVKKMVPDYKLPKAIPFKEVLSKGKKYIFDKPEIKPEDLAFLQYTGGTTGVAKGAMLSHRNVVAHTLQITEWFKPLLEKGKQEIMITAIPLYHIFALAVNGIFMTHIGARNILVTNPRDMKAFLKDLKKFPFTLITGVNTLYNGLLNQPDFSSVDFSHLKTAIGGGMAVQKAVAEKWKKVTGISLVEGYGLSETSPVLSVNPLDGRENQGTIGLPVPNTEMAIFDEEGNKMGVGEVGEICARGPQVMQGYWNRPEDSENAFFHKEWFRTGDMGIMQADGYFKIVDRKKDMINVSGFNVYPNEIEDIIAMHPKVLEIAAIGIPDERSSEVVKACVVKKDPSLTKDELIAYCRENMTAYKVPKVVEFREELPKSNVGKILRRLLREEGEQKTM